jgi:sugar phosphate isomerase/epimerase
MYKSLCTDGLGVTIRQNELIELALTFGFKGIEIDMDDMVGRAEKMGDEFATQFVNAANVEISTFGMPIDFNASDADFEAQSGRLDKVCKLAKSIGAKHCYIKVKPTHPALPYQENFEKHRARISRIADRMAEIGTKVGLQFLAGGKAGDDMRFIHQGDEILALVKAIGHANVGFVLDVWNWQVAGGTLSEIKELNLDKIFEVRLADPVDGFDPANVDRSKRLEPGTNSNSLCQGTLDWLVESSYEGPVALTAQVPKQPGNMGDILFQRIAKVLDQMLEGTHGQQPEDVASEEQADEEAETETDATVATSSS